VATVFVAIQGPRGWAESWSHARVILLAISAQVVLLFVGLGTPLHKRVSARTRKIVLLIVTLSVLAVLWQASSERLPTAEFFAGAPLALAIRCGVVACAVGGLATVSIFLSWRGTDPFTPRLSGAIAGLAGGMVGAVVLGRACPSDEAWHIVLGHGLAVLLLAGAGSLAGRRLFVP
jgi:hypothetical protein